jgi:hypothetical protein
MPAAYIGFSVPSELNLFLGKAMIASFPNQERNISDNDEGKIRS